MAAYMNYMAYYPKVQKNNNNTLPSLTIPLTEQNKAGAEKRKVI